MVNKSSTIRQKFEGPSGEAAIHEALRAAKMVHCNAKAAGWLKKFGKLKFYEKGKNLINQGDHTSSLFVILAGSISIWTHGNGHRSRGPGDHVGEMAAIDVGQPRSASVIAVDDVAALELSAKVFLQFLQKYPDAAVEVSKELARRLRQRDEYFRTVNKKPKAFIISAKESKSVAAGLQQELKKTIDVQVWWSETFDASGYTLPDLVKALNSCDFAIAVGDPVDQTLSRKSIHLSVRDNVLLEYGMAISALTLERAYYLSPQKVAVVKNKFTGAKNPGASAKKASDLVGLNIIPYEKKRKFKPEHISDAVEKILAQVQKLGPLQTTKPKNQI
jgi:CRP/FNR family transcriptional regulator, cyclic AMP receptor protein